MKSHRLNNLLHFLSADKGNFLKLTTNEFSRSSKETFKQTSAFKSRQDVNMGCKVY